MNPSVRQRRMLKIIAIGWIAAFHGVRSTPSSVAEVAALADGAYALIVNTENTVSGDLEQNKKLIKALYLKERSQWAGGAEAKPFGRPAGHDAHVALRDQILSMTEAELTKYWLDQKQKTGATPPREVDTASMLIKFVAKYEGAFGVVAREEAEAAASEVRVLFTFGG